MLLRFSSPASRLCFASSTALLLVACCACSASENNIFGNTGGAGGTGGGSGGSGGLGSPSTTAGVGGGGGGIFSGGTGGGSGGSGPSLIYAHTNTTLFTLDPTTPNLSLTTIGDFDCIGTGVGQVTSMTDIAVDGNQNIFTVSAYAVHPITLKGSTAHCGAPITLNDPNLGDPAKRFYGLSLAPAGVLDAKKEVLVAGNTAGELWSIDAQGNAAQHGIFGTVPANDGHGHVYGNAGKAWELSGDVVFLANNGSPVGFATVRDCPSPPSSNGCDKYADKTPILDTLIEIDLSKLATATATTVITKAVRGKIVTRQGCTDMLEGNYGHMFGIAAWNDKVYGFSSLGNLVEIDSSNGASCLVQGYTNNKFAGAGVTTLAPILPPPS